MERILTPKGRFYHLNFHFFFYNITEILLTTENIEMQYTACVREINNEAKNNLIEA